MKKLIAVIAIIGCSFNSYSQIKFGPLLGFNVSKGTSDGINFETEAKVKPQIGVVTSYSLSEKLDLESGLIANFKGHNFTAIYFYDYGFISGSTTVKGERNLFYLTIPIYVSYNKLMEKGKIGVLTGPEISVLAHEKSTITNGAYMPSDVTYPRLDAGWAIGIKAESYKGYGVRMQYCIGLRDTWVVDSNRQSFDFTSRNNDFKISAYYLFGGGIQ